MNRLRAVPMAVGMGIAWGLGIMCLGWISATGLGARVVSDLASLYLGYSSSLAGGLIGGAWAFVDAFLAGLVLAFAYNTLAGRTESRRIRIFPEAGQPSAG